MIMNPHRNILSFADWTVKHNFNWIDFKVFISIEVFSLSLQEKFVENIKRITFNVLTK